MTGWAEDLGQLLVPNLGGGLTAELGGEVQWSQGRLLAEGGALGAGGEGVASEVQKALQLGKQTEALR